MCRTTQSCWARSCELSKARKTCFSARAVLEDHQMSIRRIVCVSPMRTPSSGRWVVRCKLNATWLHRIVHILYIGLAFPRLYKRIRFLYIYSTIHSRLCSASHSCAYNNLQLENTTRIRTHLRVWKDLHLSLGMRNMYGNRDSIEQAFWSLRTELRIHLTSTRPVHPR